MHSTHLVNHYLCKLLHRFIRPGVSPLLPDKLDWNQFEYIAARNGLIPIVYSILKDTTVPVEKLLNWRHVSIQTIANNTRALNAATKLFAILENEGIPAVAMRGLALTQLVYADSMLRPMVDVDLLIPSRTRDYIVQRLRTHGLVPKQIFRSQFVYEIESTRFEIHWSFLTPKRYRSQIYDVWTENRIPLNTEYGMIYCLSPENELINLICHAFIHHELDTLLKLVDISLVANSAKLDWRYILRWFEETEMTRILYITLGFIDFLFDFEFLKRFPYDVIDLPLNSDKYFQAYAAHLFSTDNVLYALRRKKVLMFVAKKPSIKLKQLIRLISKDQISDIFGTAGDNNHRRKHNKYQFHTIPRRLDN